MGDHLLAWWLGHFPQDSDMAASLCIGLRGSQIGPAEVGAHSFSAERTKVPAGLPTKGPLEERFFFLLFSLDPTVLGLDKDRGRSLWGITAVVPLVLQM